MALRMLWGKSVGAPDGAAAPHEVAWPARANRRHRGRNRDGRQRLPGVGGQPGNAGAAALRGMRQETSARLHCVLAICDQGLGSCAVGAARVLEGPVRHGPLERLRSWCTRSSRKTFRARRVRGCIDGLRQSPGWQRLNGTAFRQFPLSSAALHPPRRTAAPQLALNRLAGPWGFSEGDSWTGFMPLRRLLVEVPKKPLW